MFYWNKNRKGKKEEGKKPKSLEFLEFLDRVSARGQLQSRVAMGHAGTHHRDHRMWELGDTG